MWRQKDGLRFFGLAFLASLFFVAVVFADEPALSESASTVSSQSGSAKSDDGWFRKIYQRGGGAAQLHYAYDFQDDSRDEDLWDTRLKVSAWAEFKPWKKSKLRLSAIALEGLYGRLPDQSVVLEQIYRVPNEAYLMQSVWKFDFTVGYQIQKWGVNEFLSPTDNLNPLDLRGFIDPDKEDITIPVPMARAVFFITDFIFIEGVYIPFFYSSEFHEFDTDFALCQTTDVCGIDSSIKVKDEDISTSDQWQAGVRARAELGDFTVELSYLRAHETFPNFYSKTREDVTYDDIYIEKQYPRYDVMGGGVGWRYKKVALRAEGAYSPERRYTTYQWAFYNMLGQLRPVLKYGETPYYTWAVEGEFTPSRRLYASVGYQEFVLTDPPEELVLSSEISRVALLLLRASVFREKLIFKVGTLYFIEDKDYALTPRVVYRPNDNLEFSVGANILEGERVDTKKLGGIAPMSLYTDNDQAFAGVRYNF